MTRKELIEGGWIDKYVLGLTSDEESGKVERLAQLYPEVQEQINQARARLCGSFNRKLTQPALRHSLLTKRRVIYGASAIALFAVAGFAFMCTQHFSLKSDYNSQCRKLAQEQAKVSHLASLTQDAADRSQFINSSTTQRIKLKGCESLPDAEVLVYQCRSKGKMMLEVIDLPVLPEGHHYEVWAHHPDLPDRKVGQLLPPIRYDSLYVLDTAMQYSMLQITGFDPVTRVSEAICLATIKK